MTSAPPRTMLASSQTATAACDVGMVGLAVMGQNLVLNLADHGYRAAVYNRTPDVTHEFVAAHPPDSFGPLKGGLVGAETLQDFLKALKQPRIIILLVKAGPAVEAVCDQLIAAGAKPDDIVVDGGNSLWTDTIAREQKYRGKIIFFGSGVSGGEEGARFGPSLMPGGDPQAWKRLKPIWESIAAKIDPKTGKPIEGASPGHPIIAPAPHAEPCTAYIGPNGAGHYVKMVHNGIEYADMQLICEAYFLMKHLLGMKPDEMSEVFADWNKGDLDSFLIEITADILQQKDPPPHNKRKFLIDSVLDSAGQKGTGKWTSVNALDMGVAAPSIAEAVFARIMSAMKDERIAASKLLKGPKPKKGARGGGRKKLIIAIRDALYCSKVCAYAQGFDLMAAGQREYNWQLNFGEIAMIWRGGCIIRARFLQKIKDAFERAPTPPGLPNLLLDPYFRSKMKKMQPNWRKVVALAAESGVASPAFMSSLAYFDGYRSATLPANLLQAQRDYFGAHTFERTDAPRGQSFHVDWPNPQRPITQVV
jgi:6-phosphogluconate dehydrogenase